MLTNFYVLLFVFIGLADGLRSRRPSPATGLYDFSKRITVDDILTSIISNRTTCQNIARLFIARIRLYNGRLGAVTVLNSRGALADAKRLDTYRKRRRGRLFGRLHCVPTLIKDNILVAGLPLTLGLWIFANSTAKTDASAVWKLKSEGALILGKANLPPFSFALKSPDEPSEIAGSCRNPYHVGDAGTVYGGSCGNAVGQAAQLAVIGLATDTAGSVTWPASACGLVAVRPTSKKQNADGIFPLLRNAGDTIAPITATVSDAILLLDILSYRNRTSRDAAAHPTSRDAAAHRTSRDAAADRTSRDDVASADSGYGGPFKIGIIRDLLYSRANSAVNFTRIDGSITPYDVDEEIITATGKFLNQLTSTGKVSVVNLSISLDAFTQQIHSIQRAWTDVFACTPQWIDTFFKKYPLLVKVGNTSRSIESFHDLLSVNGIPGHYKRFYQLFSQHKSHCLPSLRRLRKIRSSAKRILQKSIFESDNVDVIAYPRPRSLSSSLQPADSILMLDPAGALGFPAMNLPIGFCGDEMSGKSGRDPETLPIEAVHTQAMKGDRRRYSPRKPIGLYLMTRPRKFDAMLEIARIYEKSKGDQEKESFLPPEFV